MHIVFSHLFNYLFYLFPQHFFIRYLFSTTFLSLNNLVNESCNISLSTSNWLLLVFSFIHLKLLVNYMEFK